MSQENIDILPPHVNIICLIKHLKCNKKCIKNLCDRDILERNKSD